MRLGTLRGIEETLWHGVNWDFDLLLSGHCVLFYEEEWGSREGILKEKRKKKGTRQGYGCFYSVLLGLMMMMIWLKFQALVTFILLSATSQIW